jgi:hypothetical protein
MGAVSVMMEGVYWVGQSSGRAIRFGAVSPVTRSSFGRFQIGLSYTSYILDALYLDVFTQGIFIVPIKVIVIHFRLKVSSFVNFTKHLSSGRMASDLIKKSWLARDSMFLSEFN